MCQRAIYIYTQCIKQSSIAFIRPISIHISRIKYNKLLEMLPSYFVKDEALKLCAITLTFIKFSRLIYNAIKNIFHIIQI